QIEAVLIHFWTDKMRRQIPGLRGQLDADVATDLANPHLKPVNRERGQPQPQMIPLADAVAGFSQRAVLLAPKDEQRADRCVEIFTSEQEGPDGTVGTVDIERLIEPP